MRFETSDVFKARFYETPPAFISSSRKKPQRFYHGVVFGSNKQTSATDFYESSVSESLLWSRDCSIAIDCQSHLTLTHLSKPNLESSPFSMIAGYFWQVVLSHDGLDDYSVHLLDIFFMNFVFLNGYQGFCPVFWYYFANHV